MSGSRLESVAQLQQALRRRSKHSRVGPQLRADGDPWLWYTTKPRPWSKKRKNRAANRVARQSRKRNRRE